MITLICSVALMVFGVYELKAWERRHNASLTPEERQQEEDEIRFNNTNVD